MRIAALNYAIVGDRLILTGSYEDTRGRAVQVERVLQRVQSGAGR